MFVCPECGASSGELGFCSTDGTKLVSNDGDPLIGTTIGHYQIARLLGVGGMGRVYKGVNPAIASRVAIKVLSHDCASSAELVERFFAEARAVNVIRHENIVNVLDLSTLPDGRPYIVMEYLDGAALSAVMESSPRLPLGSFIRVLTEVLDALEAAHAKSIVHRDLKPDNIFVSPNGHAKVLDFGIAKLMPEHSGRSGPTRAGSLLGTPHYMAPEQAKSEAVDARTDIYAAGVILFEGTTGSKLFNSDSLFELLRRHIEEPPRFPRSIRADIPLALESTILKALAKDPNHRHQSVRELAEELSQATHFLAPDAWTSIGTGHGTSLSIPAPLTGTGPTQAPHASEASAPPPRHHSQSLPTPLHQAGVRADLLTSSKSRKQGLMIGLPLVALVGLGVAAALWTGENEEPETIASVRENDAASIKIESDAQELEAPVTSKAPAAMADAGETQAAAPPSPVHTNKSSNPVHKPATRVAENEEAEEAEEAGKAGEAGHAGADAGISRATETRQVDISHQTSSTPNPAAFDINGYIPTAYKKARLVFADAELVRIDADGVLPNGKANLKIDSSYSVLYRFQSRANSKRPKDLPLGVDHKATCMYYVNVSAANVDAYGLKGWKCEMEYAGKPKCSAKEVWAQAISKGAPASDAVAGLWYAKNSGKGRWSFSIKGTEFSWWIPDTC